MYSTAQKILKTDIQMKPEAVLLGLMDKQLEKTNGILFLYMPVKDI